MARCGDRRVRGRRARGGACDAHREARSLRHGAARGRLSAVDHRIVADRARRPLLPLQRPRGRADTLLGGRCRGDDRRGTRDPRDVQLLADERCDEREARRSHARARDDRVRRSPPPPQAPSRMGHPMSANSTDVLLVEDDARLADLTSRYLRQNGLTVEVESNGAAAVARFHAVRPRLVLLDLMLPGKDGLTICRELRQTFTGPILMLTAKDADIDQVIGLEAGADDYVAKPVEPMVLLARIRALL